MGAHERTTNGSPVMTAAQAARLAVYVNVRHGVGICCTPVVSEVDPSCFGVDLHLRGNPQHAKVWLYSRKEVNDAADRLWCIAFPEIPE